jgi:hypothetical protein
MQSLYNDAFEKEIDEYLASLDPLDEQAEAKYIAYCEQAFDKAMEAAFGVEIKRSEEKFVTELPF